jgi:lipopolysaccharide exporter
MALPAATNLLAQPVQDGTMTDTPTPGVMLAKMANGAGWVVGWRLTTRLLGLVNMLTLAHLLLPSDFGLVALGAGFAGAVDSLSALGVEEAVIRIKTPSRDLYNTGFTLNVLRGLGTAVIVATAALPVAAFFKDPRLTHVMLALAAGSLFTSFENIGIVDFRRDIAFHNEFKLMVGPRIASIAVTIGMAFVFRSYWALIFGILTMQVLRVALGYAMSPYRPRFTLRAWHDLAGFSFWTWALSIVGLIRDRCDSFVIGRALGAAQVGVFTLGSETAFLPTAELVASLGRAVFSGFSAARHSGLGAGDVYFRIIASTALLTIPAGVGISLIADPLVKLAFGSQWLAATTVVEALGLAGSIALLGYISGALFSAYGLLGSMFRMQLVCTAVRLVLLILLVTRLGLAGAAIAAATAMSVENAMYLVATLRRFGLRVSDLIRHTWRCLLATVAMALVLYMTGLGWHRASGDSIALLTRLLVAVSAGAAIYIAVLALAWVAVGRPAGGEMDLLELIQLSRKRLLGLLRGRKPAVSA